MFLSSHFIVAILRVNVNSGTGQNGAVSTVTTVRLIPDISAAAFKHKETKQLALFYCLKALNVTGCGKLDITRAIDGLIDVFCYTRRTVYRHLAAGDGDYWVRDGARLFLRSYRDVAAHLGIEFLTDKHFRECPVDKFDTLIHRRKAIYASIHRPDSIKGSPRSRASIEDSTGLARVQQRRYELVSGGVKVKRVPTYAVKRNNGVFQPIRMTILSRTKSYEINSRLPNVYYSDLQAGSRGQLKHLVRLNSSGKRSLIVAEALQHLTRRYHRVFKGLSRLLQRLREPVDGYVLVRASKRLIHGRLEFEKVVLVP